jgi:hypothetical protein
MPRRDSKPEIAVPRKVTYAQTPGDERATGWIVKLSVVGVEVESLQVPPAGSDLIVWARFADGGEEFVLRGRVQWSVATKFAVQFGPLGAKETHAIVAASGRSAA